MTWLLTPLALGRRVSTPSPVYVDLNSLTWSFGPWTVVYSMHFITNRKRRKDSLSCAHGQASSTCSRVSLPLRDLYTQKRLVSINHPLLHPFIVNLRLPGSGFQIHRRRFCVLLIPGGNVQCVIIANLSCFSIKTVFRPPQPLSSLSSTY